MSIDWITVVAQLANFLVLVWLLKRFLYRPILDGIDAREAEIAERMQVAVRAKEAAAASEADYRNQLSSLQSQQAAVVDAAHRQAEQDRDALLAQAHERIEHERTAWQAHLDEEARNFTAKMHRAGGHALLELTRKALTDLADETLEARVAAHLARQIGPMGTDLRAAAGETVTAVVTSREDLPDSVQAELTDELNQVFTGIEVRFKTDDQQAPGLSMHLGGAHLEWTVDTYIDELDALIAEQISASSETRV